MYIPHHHNTVVQFIEIRKIMDLCLVVERRPGVQVSQCWWYQENLDPEGMWEAARVLQMAGTDNG